MKKIIFAQFMLFTGIFFTSAQNTNPFKRTFIFSAIKGTASKSDSVLLPANAAKVKPANGDTASFKILSYKKRKLIMVFTPSPDFTGITKATLQVKNLAGKTIDQINLTGLSTNALEGENEPALSTVITALGYIINIGWTTLSNHSRPELQGDEISYSLFRKAAKGNIEIIPVARYSPDFELPFGYYVIKEQKPELHQVGVLAKAKEFPEHQCLFPSLASGADSFDPGNSVFGFYATGPTHTGYSEDTWNMLLFPNYSVRATRIYPIKDASGKLLINSYLVCFEEAKNGDYNDYVFVVKNIVPVTK